MDNIYANQKHHYCLLLQLHVAKLCEQCDTDKDSHYKSHYLHWNDISGVSK